MEVGSNDNNKPHKAQSDNLDEVSLRTVEFPDSPLEAHIWKQQGHVVKCVSCEATHVFYLPRGYMFDGIEKDGSPILVKVA